MNIEIYTDGGCHGNPGPGGWAFLIREASGEVLTEKYGAEANTTNNRMELRAAIEALGALGTLHPSLEYEKGDRHRRFSSSLHDEKGDSGNPCKNRPFDSEREGKGRPRCTLWTDSEYVKNGITTWISNWKKNGWKTANKKPVKNADLWQQLDALAAAQKIAWRWVRGHDGNEFNERVDALTQQAMAEGAPYGLAGITNAGAMPKFAELSAKA